MAKQIFLTLMIMSGHLVMFSQQKLGINTSSPYRTLDVFGTGDQHIRIHASTSVASAAGFELLRGTNDLNSQDWKIVNDGGTLKIRTSNDNFNVNSDEVLRIGSTGKTGIGTTTPQAKLHIDGGSLITFGGHGYLKTGNVNSYNLAFDPYQIRALNNGLPSPLYFQSNGGHTNFGLTGGNVYMGMGSGSVGVGTTSPESPLDIADDAFQLFISNTTDDANTWYIGASDDSWQAGDNQLLFSPTSSSSDAVFRLMDVNENDGNTAPVMIHTNADHTILLDGNEIDTRGTPLYINHNTDENTYINPSGGRVGIGNTNPQAALHVSGTSSHILSLQRDNAKWNILPSEYAHENLTFYYNDINSPLAQIDGISGQWMHLSDRNFKENILPATDVLSKLTKLMVYNYSFRQDSSKKDHVGVIAQEAEPLFPEIVRENEGQYGIAYSQLAALGIKAIQEQQVLIDTLKEKINLLKLKGQNLKEETSAGTP